MRRRIEPEKGGKPKNELNGREVIAEPLARKRGRPSKYKHIRNEELKEKALVISDGRADLSEKDHAMYRELKNRRLLEETFGTPRKRGRPKK